jgi:DNA-directed RNA polymerase specialized sigma24 family protein
MHSTRTRRGERDLPTLTDEALMRGAREGDHEAWQEIERRYRPLAEGVVAALRGRKSAARLADEALRRVFEHRGRYRPGRDVAAWIFAFSRHVALTLDDEANPAA